MQCKTATQLQGHMGTHASQGEAVDGSGSSADQTGGGGAVVCTSSGDGIGGGVSVTVSSGGSGGTVGLLVTDCSSIASQPHS